MMLENSENNLGNMVTRVKSKYYFIHFYFVDSVWDVIVKYSPPLRSNSEILTSIEKSMTDNSFVIIKIFNWNRRRISILILIYYKEQYENQLRVYWIKVSYMHIVSLHFRAWLNNTQLPELIAVFTEPSIQNGSRILDYREWLEHRLIPLAFESPYQGNFSMHHTIMWRMGQVVSKQSDAVKLVNNNKGLGKAT